MYIVWDIDGYEIYSKKLDLAIRNVDLTWFIQLSSVQNQCWLMISSGIILVTHQSWEYHERNTVIKYKWTKLGRFIGKKMRKQWIMVILVVML